MYFKNMDSLKWPLVYTVTDAVYEKSANACGNFVNLYTLKRIFFAILMVGAMSIVFDLALSRQGPTGRFLYRSNVTNERKRYLRADPKGVLLDDVQAYKSNLLIRRTWSDEDLRIRYVKLNINKSDVIVFEHIQKTGGTVFEDAFVHSTNIKPPCRCVPMYAERIMCYCRNSKAQDWLFNRHAVGWACGVHADFTELTSCLNHWYDNQDNEKRLRRYHFTTLIRDPATRFISEWLHVRRGATWKECRLHCGGRDASLREEPFCFQNGNWSNVSFEEYMRCPYNMAFNRQTRMLANLTLSDCYRTNSNLSRYQRDEIMLQSAKDNLRLYFRFFGMLEYPDESQTLFEKTFEGLKFTKRINMKKVPLGASYTLLSEYNWNRIVEKNLLDVRLFQFAKDLFLQRLKRVKIPIVYHQSEAKFVMEDFRYLTVGI